MTNSEYTITHRKVQQDFTTVEHLISIVPFEDLFQTINRIHPSASDEIVIKIIDENLLANIEARKSMEEQYWSYHEEVKIKKLAAEAGNRDNNQGPY